MASSATLTKSRSRVSALHTTITNVNLGTYATGGVTVTPLQLGLSSVDFAIITTQSTTGATASNSIHYFYNPQTLKVKAYTSGSSSEVPSATDLSAVTLQFVSFGA